MKFRAYLYLTLLIFLFQGNGVLIGQPWRLYENGGFAKSSDNEIVFTPQRQEADSRLSWALQIREDIVALDGQLVWTDQNGQETNPLLQQKTVDLQDELVQTVFSFNDLSIELRLQLKATERGLLLTVFSDQPLPSVLRNEMAFRLSLHPSVFLENTFLADQIAGIFPLYPSPEHSVWPDGRQWLIPLAGGRSFTFIREEYTLVIKALMGGLSLEDRRKSWSEGFFNLYTLLPTGKTGKLAEWEIEVRDSYSGSMTDDIISVQTGYHASQGKYAILPGTAPGQVYARLLKIDSDSELSPVLTGPIMVVNHGEKQQLRFDFSPIHEEGLYVIQYGELYSRPIIISKWVYEQARQEILAKWLALHAQTIRMHQPNNSEAITLAVNLRKLCQIWDLAAPAMDHKTLSTVIDSIAFVPDGKADALQSMELLSAFLIDLDFAQYSTEDQLQFTTALVDASIQLEKAEGYSELSKLAIHQAITLWEAATKETNNKISVEKLSATFALWQATGEEQYLEQCVFDWQEIEPSFDNYIEVLSSAYSVLSTKDQNAFRRLAARWSKEHSPQGDRLSLIPPVAADYEVLLSNALNSWFLHQTFPETVSDELVFSTLDYIHGLQENGGRSLVAGVGQRSCYLDDHLPMAERGCFWQVARLTNKSDFDLTGCYLQLLYVARHLLNPRDKRKGSH